MPTVTLQKYPAISVVIPMYNTEKYIGACLTSLLAQTFPNFEVIVVDDCSTDNSRVVVESFIPKFSGHLKLLHLEQNSGGLSTPANKGINFSRGKYIHVMDSDDLLTNNALEVLINLAEKYDADVVNMDLGFRFDKNSENPFPTQNDIKIAGWHSEPFVDKPMLESDDIAERVKKIARNGVGWTAWQKFVRRDFLIENGITFPNMTLYNDVAWVIATFCLSKKVLTISELLYIFRIRHNSHTNAKRTTEQVLRMHLNSVCVGIKYLDDILSKQKFFLENPQCLWELLRFFEGTSFIVTQHYFSNMKPYEMYNILKNQFKELYPEDNALISYFLETFRLSYQTLHQMFQRIAQLENQVRELQKPK